MAQLIPLDYDALAGATPTPAPADVPTKGAIPATPEEDRATREQPAPPPEPEKKPEPPPEQPPPEKQADYVVPAAPALPTVKFAGEEKPKEKPKPALMPLDYDALDTAPRQGHFLVEAPKALAAGAVEQGGQILRGMGGQRTLSKYEQERADARAKVLEQFGIGGGLSKAGIYNPADIAALPQDKQQALVTALQQANDGVAPPDLTEDPFYKAGIATQNWSQDNLKAAHDYENSWTRAIGTGLGSIAPFLAVGATGPLAPVIGAEMGAGQGAGEAIDNAVQAGASRQQIMSALRFAAIPGLTDQAGAEALLEKIPLPMMGKFMTVLSRIGAKALIEGGQEGVQQVMQNVITKYNYDPKKDLMDGVAQSAGMGALVGGVVASVEPHTYHTENVQHEEHPKVDDQPGVAAPTQTEGTPAATPAATAAETSTPGDTSAATPKQPAGTEKQPAPPVTPATTPLQPAQTPGATHEGGVPADVGAAIGARTGQPAAEPAPQPAAQPQQAEAFDIRQAIPDTASAQEVNQALGEHEQRIADMFAARQRQQETNANKATVAPAGEDVAAALNATVAPQGAQVGGGVGPQVVEPMGTGQALQQITPHLRQRLTQLGYSPEDIGAMSTGQAWAAARGPAKDLATPMPAGPQVAEAAITPEPTGGAPLPSGQADLRPGLETTAATPEAAAAPASQPAATEQPAAAPAPEMTQEPAPAPPESVAAFQTQPEPQVAPVAKPAPQPTPQPAAAQPVTKGKAIVEEVKRRKQARQAPGEAPVTEAPVARPTATRVSEAAPAAEEGPPRTRLSRDAAESARTHPDLQRSAVSELPGFEKTLSDVAAEVVARKRQESPGASPGQIIRESEPEIVAGVKERMAPAEAEADKALPVETEKTPAQQIKEERQAQQAEKTKAQATAETGQKKERAGKAKGKSATGILAESEKTTKRAVKKNNALPEGQRDPLLSEWDRINSLQNALPKNPKQENRAAVEAQRADFMAQKQAIQEQRAAQVEAAVEARGGLAPERAAARDQVRSVLDQHPLPDLAGPARTQMNALVAHVRAFKAAVKAAGIELSSHIDRVHQSMEENLAIFARKVSTKADAEVTPHDFAMAQLFADKGAAGDFYNLVTGDKLEGSTYSEDIGEDTSRDVSTPEDEELSHLAGPYQQPEFAAGGEEEARPRAGAGIVQTIERARSQAARDEAQRKPQRDITVTRPSDGARVTVSASTRKGSDVLREISRKYTRGRLRGFVGTIHNALVRHLTSMVGDIDVHFVSAADMMQLHTNRGMEPAGLYYNYSAADRAAGRKPMVFVLDELVLHPAEYVHTVMHEMTHAATSLALHLDTRGTRSIVDNLMRDLKGRLAPSEIAEFGHAFTNPSEFIAEAFSNHRFQELLSTTNMPEDLRRQIGGVAANRQPSFWDSVVSMISNAVGMLWGQRGQSYMEHVARLFPDLATSQMGQVAMARKAMREAPAARTQPRELTGERPMATEREQAFVSSLKQLYDGAKSRAENIMTPGGRRLRDRFATSGELQRRSEAEWGGPNNPLEHKINVSLLERDHLRQEYRDTIPGKNGAPDVKSREVQLAQMEFKQKHLGEFEQVEDLLHEASRFSVDPTVPLSAPPNGHINKTGPTHNQIRAVHDRLSQVWGSLSSGARDIAHKTIEHFRAAAQAQSEAIIRHGIENAQRYGAELPAGKDVNDAIKWIMSGDAARPVENQTQGDKDFHKALGNTATTLAHIPFLRKVKGVYVPFLRNGQYFLSAIERPFGKFTEQRNVPRGATLDAVTEAEKNAPNRLLFHDENDLNAFTSSYPGQVRVQIQHIDPATGKRVAAQEQIKDPTAPGGLRSSVPLYVATVQNRRVEMSDNQSYLKGRAQQLADEGHDVGSVGLSQQHLSEAVRQMQTPEVSRLINNLKQTTPGENTVSQQAVEAAINDAFLRSITQPSQLQRGLKRSGVLGEDVDLVKSTRDYNRGLAHHLANLEMAPKMATADKAVADYIKARRQVEKASSNSTIIRQSMNDEVNKRILGYSQDSSNGKFAHIMQTVANITYLRHLMSPHFTIMNLVQPYTTTLPVLGGKYGYGAASRELGRAYRLGMKTTRTGFREFGRQLTNVGKMSKEALNLNQYWRDEILAHEPDAAELQDMTDHMVRRGMGASSGVESSAIAELDMNLAGKALHRSMQMAKSMPEWAEAINRFTTAVATYRLARREGLSHELAVREAVLKVEETQGGYGAANNPTFFRNPILKPALMFRKYGLMYGQLFYKNMIYSIRGNQGLRKEAIKTLLGLTATLVSVAGVYGLPMVEPLRMVTNILAAMGLKDDDWDKTESDLQKGLSSLIQWAGGSKSLADALSEANMRGWTRLANIDTQNMFGADSLVAYGQPKSMDEEGTLAWMMKTIMGAQGGMLFDSGKALVNGDISGAIPYPKIADNLIKAYGLKTKGTVSKTTGEQYHEPYSWYEAGAKALGFRPAEESRPFEGGTASASKQLRDTGSARRTLMARWRNATGSDRQDLYQTKIRDWNASHPNQHEKIRMPDLIKSISSRRKYEQRVQQEMESEQ